MQHNIYIIIQEFLVVAFVWKEGQKCSVVSIMDISTRNVIDLPVACGSLQPWQIPFFRYTMGM